MRGGFAGEVTGHGRVWSQLVSKRRAYGAIGHLFEGASNAAARIGDFKIHAFGQSCTVPARTEIIPGFWTNACELPVTAADAAVQAVATACGQAFFVPEQVIQIPEQVFIDGGTGSSIASKQRV